MAVERTVVSAFESSNYRKTLHEMAKSWKASRPGWTLQRLAEKTQIQAPYLTNVFKERAHLSMDQLFAVCEVLQLPEEEREFLQSLLEWERSGHPERRKRLKERIEVMRKEKLQSKANLKKEILATESSEMTRFFLNPYYRLINAFLGVARFTKEPHRIADCLNLSRRQLIQWMKDLESMGFVKVANGGRYEKLKRNFHLPKESPLCEPHQNLLQQCAHYHQQGLEESEKFNFVLTFSADEAAREAVLREFQKFLKNIEGVVKDAPSEQVFGLHFDLFKWSSERR